MKKLACFALSLALSLSLLPAGVLALGSEDPSSETVPQTAEDVRQTWDSPFTDVTADDWFFSDVEYAVENDLMQGVTPSRFLPGESLTRAQLVTVLWRMAGEPTIYFIRQPDPVFADVTGDEWFAQAVQWAALTGIVQGDDGNFLPGLPVTRAQLVTVLYRYAQNKGFDVSVGEDTNILSYGDAFTLPEYSIPAFQWACGAGIISGNNGNLLPRARTNRAQACAVLHRLRESVQ